MTTVAELTKMAAMSYLQSAVFIDDEIYSRSMPLPTEEVPVRGRKKMFPVDQADPQPASSTVTASELPPFHPREIVASFARSGIVCALYEPPTDFATDENSEVFKLCEAADLIILDWDFHKDEGTKMRELIKALIIQSSHTLPHHSRLVIVYTTTPSLEKVGSSLFEKLAAAQQPPQLVEGSPLRFDVGATRIVILGKGDGSSRVDAERSFTVSEADLANRVITEFVSKNNGVLSSYALLGIAAVKRSSQRILSKFNQPLDGAFLVHRAFLLHNEDAFEELPSLITDEFLAVIQDSCRNLGSMTHLVENAVATLPVTHPTPAWALNSGQPAPFESIVKDFIIGGATKLESHKSCNQVKKLLSSSGGFSRAAVDQIKALAATVESTGSNNNRKLAALFNSRTFYGQAERPLTFGTIIKRPGVTDQPPVYSICLMPVCDSLRLETGKVVSFPFCLLDARDLGPKKGRGFVVEIPNGAFIELLAAAKPSDIWMELFVPSGGTGIVEAKPDRGAFWFETSNTAKLEWIAQLKPAHAQRIAYDLGQSLTRIGLAEAEWVRLISDRSS